MGGRGEGDASACTSSFPWGNNSKAGEVRQNASDKEEEGSVI